MIFQRNPAGGFRQVEKEVKTSPRPKGAVDEPGAVVRALDWMISPLMRLVYEKVQFAGVWVTLTTSERSYVLHAMTGIKGKTHNVYFGRLADGTFLAGVD